MDRPRRCRRRRPRSPAPVEGDTRTAAGILNVTGGPVLVVGATGILRPAVAALTARGDRVVAAARGKARLRELASTGSGVAYVVADALHPERLRSAIAGHRPDGGLLYCPDADASTLRRLTSCVPGRMVVLLTSRWADPAAGDVDLAGLRARVGGPVLLLGWRPDRTWHSPAEVSAGALRVFDSGADEVLGVVRPWDPPS